jgi:hypothetical protein
LEYSDIVPSANVEHLHTDGDRTAAFNAAFRSPFSQNLHILPPKNGMIAVDPENVG